MIESTLQVLVVAAACTVALVLAPVLLWQAWQRARREQARERHEQEAQQAERNRRFYEGRALEEVR
ncbi:MAG: hypothetical protein EHM35_00340 [Planctomycetaceae bacterium]|nr:MAG: hypothetical protein EHM35_00340 [Planctomycetaceae bacterium]